MDDYKGYQISIEPDTDVCESPREWARVGTILTFHRQGDYGEVAVSDFEDDFEIAYDRPAENVEDWEMFLREQRGARVVRRVWHYTHSGMTIRVADSNPFHCRWDSGIMGLVYDTPEGIKACWGDTEPTDEQLAKAMESEVESYDQYLRGDVYGYVIESPDGSSWIGDSCWGFYGEDYAMSEAKAAVDAHIAYLAREDAKVNRCMAL